MTIYTLFVLLCIGGQCDVYAPAMFDTLPECMAAAVVMRDTEARAADISCIREEIDPE